MAWQKPFSEQEDEFIRRNWPVKTPTEIAAILGRSRPGVSARITKLGLRDGPSTMRARVIDAPQKPRDSAAALAAASRRGDEKEILETLRDVVIERISTCSSRDTAALAKRLMEIGERIAEIDGAGEPNKKKKAKSAEVTTFEVIARRRAERRKAAEG